MKDELVKFLIALFAVVIANVTYWVLTHVFHWDKIDTAFGFMMGFLIFVYLELKDIKYS